jgi:hypothetical protein
MAFENKKYTIISATKVKNIKFAEILSGPEWTLSVEEM